MNAYALMNLCALVDSKDSIYVPTVKTCYSEVFVPKIDFDLFKFCFRNHCLGYSITYPIMYTGSDVSYYLFDQLF